MIAQLGPRPDLVVGIADLKVSGQPEDRLITYSLGSCLGVTVYDPVVRVGGLLHLMLPSSTLDKEKARRAPLMFVDTGVPLLFKACYRLGAQKERMIVKVAGGARAGAQNSPDQFKIGERNFSALQQLLSANGVRLAASAVGGHQTARTMALTIDNGEVRLWSNGLGSVL